MTRYKVDNISKDRLYNHYPRKKFLLNIIETNNFWCYCFDRNTLLYEGLEKLMNLPYHKWEGVVEKIFLPITNQKFVDSIKEDLVFDNRKGFVEWKN